MPYEGTVSLILDGGPENANQQKRTHKRNAGKSHAVQDC